jgi:hypothetical protein
MKLAKKIIRFWIALTATGSFLSGWALLAHAPKPVQPAAATAPAVAQIPTLTPLAPLDLSGMASNDSLQSPQFSIQQQAPLFMQAPLFRTGGS